MYQKGIFMKRKCNSSEQNYALYDEALMLPPLPVQLV